MITEWFMTLGSGFVGWILGMLPDMDWADGIVVSASNGISSLMVAAGQISNWFPWPVMLWALTTVLTTYVMLFLAKIFRSLLTHIPLFGGRG